MSAPQEIKAADINGLAGLINHSRNIKSVTPLMETTPEIKEPWKIYHTTTTKFSFWDRIKVLLGQELKVYSVIEVDKECEPLSGKADSMVEPLFKNPFKKKIGGEEIITKGDHQ